MKSLLKMDEPKDRMVATGGMLTLLSRVGEVREKGVVLCVCILQVIYRIC